MLKRFNESWGPVGGLNIKQSKYDKIPDHIKNIFHDSAIVYNNYDEMRDICNRLIEIGYNVYNHNDILNKTDVMVYDCFCSQNFPGRFNRAYLTQLAKRPSNIMEYDNFIEITDKFLLLKDFTPADNKYEFGNPGDRAVVGVPSGQVIFMNSSQITYFESRKMIIFRNQYRKKKKDNYYEIIKLNAFCFEDKFYNDITDLMNSITW